MLAMRSRSRVSAPSCLIPLSRASLFLFLGFCLLSSAARAENSALIPDARVAAAHVGAGALQTKPSPHFSETPTDQEILVCGILPQPMAPMAGAPAADENRALARALVEYRARQ